VTHERGPVARVRVSARTRGTRLLRYRGWIQRVEYTGHEQIVMSRRCRVQSAQIGYFFSTRSGVLGRVVRGVVPRPGCARRGCGRAGWLRSS